MFTDAIAFAGWLIQWNEMKKKKNWKSWAFSKIAGPSIETLKTNFEASCICFRVSYESQNTKNKKKK